VIAITSFASLADYELITDKRSLDADAAPASRLLDPFPAVCFKGDLWSAGGSNSYVPSLAIDGKRLRSFKPLRDSLTETFLLIRGQPASSSPCGSPDVIAARNVQPI